MKLKDIVALGLLGLVTFPVVLLGVLLWTGNVRLVFGPENPTSAQAREQLLDRGDGHAVAETVPTGVEPGHGDAGTGVASPDAQAREAALDEREAELQKEQLRLDESKLENTRLADAVRAERERIEKLLSAKDSLGAVRLQMLARTFASMKPDQAAKICQGLDEVLVTSILRQISDDRPRAKILAALAKLDAQRAASVARLLQSGSSSSVAGAANPTQPQEAVR